MWLVVPGRPLGPRQVRGYSRAPCPARASWLARRCGAALDQSAARRDGAGTRPGPADMADACAHPLRATHCVADSKQADLLCGVVTKVIRLLRY